MLIRRPVLVCVAAAWFGACALGLAAMARYANRPGTPANAPSSWPAASRLSLDRSRPTLVMLTHPLCSCSRASLAELSELVARAPEAASLYIVFMKVPVDADSEDASLWRSATAIPGAKVLRDDGDESERFGAETSGQTLLYGPDGRLLFSGGMTVARGHEGDNAGLQAVLTILDGHRPATTEAPVFGCPLHDSPEDTPSRSGAR
jgi:hypothetical protein